MVAVSELVARLGVVSSIDAAAGPIKKRNRGFGLGQVLVGMAAAQLAGQDYLVGLDRVRADAAGQELMPVPDLAASTACGLARRVRPEQWAALESGVAGVHQRMLDLLPAADVLAGDQDPRSSVVALLGAPQPHSTQTPNICASRVQPRLVEQLCPRV